MSGSENCRHNFIITWFCHTNSPSTCANYPVPSKWLHFTSPLLRHNLILSWKPDGGIFGLFRETNHLFIPSAFSGRKAGGHSVWASATLTCCHICHCTKGDKGIECVLPRSDRSPALRSALLCLCLFEVLKHLGLFFCWLSPQDCVSLFCCQTLWSGQSGFRVLTGEIAGPLRSVLMCSSGYLTHSQQMDTLRCEIML